MMTLRQISNSPFIEKIRGEDGILCGDLAMDSLFNLPYLGNGPIYPQGVEIRTHLMATYDLRRFMRVRSWWYLDNVVGISVEKGREGEDYCNFFLLDKEAYPRMIALLLSSMHLESEEMIVDPDLGLDAFGFMGMDFDVDDLGKHMLFKSEWLEIKR